MKANNKIREELKKNKVFQWQLADRLEISEPTLTRLLRHELPDEKQEELIGKIREIAIEQ